MFGLSKRERAQREVQEIITWILGQSVVQGANSSPPYGHFGTHIQMMAALEACVFFLSAADRIASREKDGDIRESLQQAVFDTAFNQMVRTFSEMMFKEGAQSPLTEIKQDIANFFNARQIEYGKTPTLVSETPDDRKSAAWLTAQNIARATESTEPDIRIPIIQTELTNSLVVMDLPNRIKKVRSYLAR